MTVQKDGTDKRGNYDILLKHVDRKLRRIIDVGAWWGPWSLFWQPHAEKLEIFEPNEKIFSMLEHNVSKYTNCSLHRTALGESKGKVSMYKPGERPNDATKVETASEGVDATSDGDSSTQ